MHIFDLMTDGGATGGHARQPNNGNIFIDLKFY
jgi:hypothetical protein